VKEGAGWPAQQITTWKTCNERGVGKKLKNLTRWRCRGADSKKQWRINKSPSLRRNKGSLGALLCSIGI